MRGESVEATLSKKRILFAAAHGAHETAEGRYARGTRGGGGVRFPPRFSQKGWMGCVFSTTLELSASRLASGRSHLSTRANGKNRRNNGRNSS